MYCGGPDLTPELRQYEPVAWQFAENAAYWFRTNLKIIDRDNQLVPFVVNDQQMCFLFWVGMQLAAGVQVRIIVLKARRMGFSTVIEALGFMFWQTRPNYYVLACAHDAEGTNTLRAMVKLFQQELPSELKHPTQYDSRQDIVCSPPHRSQFLFHTAGSKGIGRSKEVTFLHISEKAHIRDWKTVGAAIPRLPENNRWACSFRESTANGIGDDGEFHGDWEASCKAWQKTNSLDGYMPLFFSWLDFPQYRKAPPDGYEFGPLDEWELRLQGLGADDEQLYFRRVVMAEDYNGDPETFAQEYPATPEEAFRQSGRPAIPQSIIRHHERSIRQPIRRVMFKRDSDGAVEAYDVADDALIYWEIWHEPHERADYAVFGDVAEGELSDPTDLKSEPDCSAGIVLNRRELRYDALLNTRRLDADQFGEQLRLCCEYYNDAWGTPEANAAGQAALVHFKDYERTYQRKQSEPVGEEERQLSAIGWKTTGANRDYMIDAWLAASRPGPEGDYEGKLVTHSAEMVEQEKTFVRKKSGKREHQNGRHDDILMAAFGAYQLHLECPRTHPIGNVQPEWPEGHYSTPGYLRLGGIDDRRSYGASDWNEETA
jgi:hypothetical protein